MPFPLRLPILPVPFPLRLPTFTVSMRFVVYTAILLGPADLQFETAQSNPSKNIFFTIFERVTKNKSASKHPRTGRCDVFYCSFTSCITQ